MNARDMESSLASIVIRPERGIFPIETFGSSVQRSVRSRGGEKEEETATTEAYGGLSCRTRGAPNYGTAV